MAVLGTSRCGQVVIHRTIHNLVISLDKLTVVNKYLKYFLFKRRDKREKKIITVTSVWQ